LTWIKTELRRIGRAGRTAGGWTECRTAQLIKMRSAAGCRRSRRSVELMIRRARCQNGDPGQDVHRFNQPDPFGKRRQNNEQDGCNIKEKSRP
jgi:hypothetical protein